jgi:hypothetical protein
MADAKKVEKPAANEDNLLLPYEREIRGNSVEEDIGNLLGSGHADFLDVEGDPEDPMDADEPDPDDDESEDGEPEDEDEDDDDDLEDEEDDDEDSEEDEDDDDEDEDEEDPEEDDLHEVKVQGETLKVALDELKAGYSRTEDYTRKRQADAAEVAEELTKTRDQRGFYEQRLQMLEEAMVELSPADPDWDELRVKNPAEYAAQRADQAERQAAIERVKEEKARVQREKHDENLAAQRELVDMEMARLVKAVPEWANQTAYTAGVESLRSFAQETYGFSDAELDNVVDHRLLLMLRDNMESREKTKSGKKEIRKKSKKSKRMKPGGGERISGKAKTKRNKRKENVRRRKQLARSGSERDAASAIENLLGDDD